MGRVSDQRKALNSQAAFDGRHDINISDPNASRVAKAYGRGQQEWERGRRAGEFRDRDYANYQRLQGAQLFADTSGPSARQMQVSDTMARTWMPGSTNRLQGRERRVGEDETMRDFGTYNYGSDKDYGDWRSKQVATMQGNGWDRASEAQFRRQQMQSRKAAAANVNSTMRSLRAQGMGGGGAELAAALGTQGNQMAADYDAALGAAALGQQRQDQAARDLAQAQQYAITSGMAADQFNAATMGAAADKTYDNMVDANKATWLAKREDDQRRAAIQQQTDLYNKQQYVDAWGRDMAQAGQINAALEGASAQAFQGQLARDAQPTTADRWLAATSNLAGAVASPLAAYLSRPTGGAGGYGR